MDMRNRQDTGEPRLAGIVSWIVLGSSFGLSAATWVALAELAGFTQTMAIPEIQGVSTAVTLRLAWLMPLAVDGYLVVALIMWMASRSVRVARFARTNTYASAVIGVAAQSCYHTLSTWADTGLLWRTGLAIVVGALPPAIAGLAVHMRALIRQESVRPVEPVAPIVEPMAPPVVESVAPPVVEPVAPIVEPVAPVVEPVAPAVEPVTKPPRKRSPRAATGPGTGSPRKRATKAKPEPEVVHNITTLTPTVDEVLPPRSAVMAGKRAAALPQ